MKSLWRKIRHYLKELLREAVGADRRLPEGVNPIGGDDDEPKPAGGDDDALDFALLDFCYGGFRGGGAILSGGCRIANLRVADSGMSYSWESGGCEDLGASSRSDAACLACLFVRGEDGAWRGGKFDWISTSRTSRSLENIHGGYHGWPKDAIESADAYAFVIVSKDGRKRSNVIICGR